MELKFVTTVDANNPDLGDFYLDDNNQEVLLDDLTAEVAQRIMVRFKFFRGEWFLEQSEGMPWFQSILVKGVNPGVLAARFSELILGTPGVKNVTRLNWTLDSSRELSLDFECTLDDGTVLTSADFGPFLVGG